MSQALTGYRTPSALGRYSDPDEYLSHDEERLIGDLDRERGFIAGIRTRLEFMRKDCRSAVADRLDEMIELLNDANMSGHGAISEIEQQAKDRYDGAEDDEADRQYDLWAEDAL